MSVYELLSLDSGTLLAAGSLAASVVLVCAIAMIVDRACRKGSAALRHSLLVSALGVSLLACGAVPLLTSLGWSFFQMEFAERAASPEPEQVILKDTTELADDSTIAHAFPVTDGAKAFLDGGIVNELPVRPDQRLPATLGSRIKKPTPQRWQFFATCAIGLWGVGFATGVVFLIRGTGLVRRLRCSLRVIEDDELLDLVASRAADAGLKSPPGICESPVVKSPLLLGFGRPVVVLPTGLSRRLCPDQLNAVLIHELAHLARRDHWIGLAARIAAVTFWWNPLLHAVNRRLVDLREELCDNHVLQSQDGRSFAHVLVDLAEHVTARPGPGMAIGLLDDDVAGLKRRVARLIQPADKLQTGVSPAGRVVVLGFVTLLAGIVVSGTVQAVDEKDGSGLNEVRTVRVQTSDELRKAVSEARPGTTILLAPGRYRGGLVFNDLKGAKGKPIVIAAEDSEDLPVIEGGNSCLHLTDPQYVELRQLVFTGARINGLNIDDGGTYATPAQHVVLSGLVVRDNGSRGNHDGIKLSGLDDFRIENCTVERWGKNGSGIDLVGCHRGVIDGSTFRDGDKVFGNAVQTKGGSSNITISRCRFENAGGRAINLGGSTGLAYFRPKAQGYEAKDITVEDCTFIGSMAPIAFVGVDGATVRHNTIYRPTRWVMRILQENQQPSFVPSRNGQFTSNIVVFRSDELNTAANIGAGTAPQTFQFENNFWYCIDRPEKSQRSIHLPVAELDGRYGVAPDFVAADMGDLRVRKSSPASKAGPRPKSNN